MDEQGQELPVVELQLHGGDPLQLAAELDAENARCECRNCDGTGWWDGRLCPDCGGTGELVGDVAEIAMLRKRVAELEAENAGLYTDLQAANEAAHRQQLVLGEQMTALALARRWAAAWRRAASKFRAWQADTEAALELERRAVGKLVDVVYKAGCPLGRGPVKPHPDGCIHIGHDPLPDCRACWARWARKRERAEAGGE
jgi:hypothetical protein